MRKEMSSFKINCLLKNDYVIVLFKVKRFFLENRSVTSDHCLALRIMKALVLCILRIRPIACMDYNERKMVS